LFYLPFDFDLADVLGLEKIFYNLVDFALVFGDVLLELFDEVEELEHCFLLCY
jgi:hypothetical protein